MKSGNRVKGVPGGEKTAAAGGDPGRGPVADTSNDAPGRTTGQPAAWALSAPCLKAVPPAPTSVGNSTSSDWESKDKTSLKCYFTAFWGICSLSTDPDLFSGFLLCERHNVRKACFSMFLLQDELLRIKPHRFFPLLLTQVVSRILPTLWCYPKDERRVWKEGVKTLRGGQATVSPTFAGCPFSSVLAWRRFALFEPQALYDLKKALSHKLDALAALQTSTTGRACFASLLIPGRRGRNAGRPEARRRLPSASHTAWPLGLLPDPR